jgi:hypothetical protein
VATGILVFEFGLFIGDRFDLLGNAEHPSPNLTNKAYTNVDPVLRHAVDQIVVDDVYYDQLEKILRKREELKQKKVLERKQYNSKMTIEAEIAL